MLYVAICVDISLHCSPSISPLPSHESPASVRWPFARPSRHAGAKPSWWPNTPMPWQEPERSSQTPRGARHEAPSNPHPDGCEVSEIGCQYIQAIGYRLKIFENEGNSTWVHMIQNDTQNVLKPPTSPLLPLPCLHHRHLEWQSVLV